MNETDNSFRQQLEDRMGTYRSQRERIRTKLVELNHHLNDVDRRLEAAEELYRREFGLTPPDSEPVRKRRPPVSRAGDGRRQSWREAMVSVLRSSERPLHVKEIWQALADSGFETASRDPLRSIVAIAVRDPRIERSAPNTYRLVGTRNGKPQLSLDGRPEAVLDEGGTQ